jgi:serine/threonine protein kinase/tetratricopeptide (TPR) repeat protein
VGAPGESGRRGELETGKAPGAPLPDRDETAPTGPVQPAPARPGLPTGSVVGRHIVLQEIGRGGMGVVYKAFDPALDRPIALKVLRVRHSGDIGQTRLAREARALAKLSHPNVVAVYDVGTHDQALYLAMEYVEGQTLTHWLRAAPHRASEILAAFGAAGEGLAAAHQVGIVHRDFKPDNVLVGHDGRVRVLDFGLARAADDSSPSSRRLAGERSGNDGADGTGGDDDSEGDGSKGDADGNAEPRPASAASARAKAPATTPVTPTFDLDGHGSNSAPDPLASPVTRVGQIVGTPRYMAPEQFAGAPPDPRTDQFSFCVALYAALYRRPPFPASTIEDLRQSTKRGLDAPPPRLPGVPKRVRRALARGLAPEPAARHAAMASLLAELRPVPPTRRLGVIALGAVALTAIAGAVALRSRPAPPKLCTGAASTMAQTWNPARHESLRAAFVATGKPYGADTATRVGASVDDYARVWVQAHTEACAATHLRGEQSANLLDRRMACLDRIRYELDEQLTVLTAQAATTLDGAVDAIGGLPDLSACANIETLTALAALPAAPSAKQALDGVNRAVARARALSTSGRYQEARDLAKETLEQARRVGYQPAIAAALAVLADAEQDLGELAAAQQHLYAAMAAATAGGDDVAVATAWIELVRLLGYERAQVDLALEQAAVAEAWVARLRGVSGPAQTLAATLGALHSSRGEHDVAYSHYERALALAEAEFGLEHPRISGLLNNLGEVRRRQGRHAEARALLLRSLDLKQRTLGPTHPSVAMILNNLGDVELALGALDAARDDFERALAIRTAALGPKHPKLGNTLLSLGSLSAKRGDYDAARRYYERAGAIWEAALGDKHPNLAYVYINLGDTDFAQGRLDDALATYARALAIVEASLGAKHALAAYPLTGMGRVHLLRHQPRRALPLLERAVELHAGGTEDPVLRADARFALARALADSGDPGPRAATLALEARDAYAQGADEADKRAEVDAWLGRHASAAARPDSAPATATPASPRRR